MLIWWRSDIYYANTESIKYPVLVLYTALLDYLWISRNISQWMEGNKFHSSTTSTGTSHNNSTTGGLHAIAFWLADSQNYYYYSVRTYFLFCMETRCVEGHGAFIVLRTLVVGRPNWQRSTVHWRMMRSVQRNATHLPKPHQGSVINGINCFTNSIWLPG